jgi:hypothetical protein
LGSLHALAERYGDRVAFLVVYIREAHPEDGWVVTPNRTEGIEIMDPTNDEERHAVAATCAIRLQIRMPVVVDSVDDTIARAYGALPDRLYLVAEGGQIAFQGGPGPFGFDPAALERAIEEMLAKP